IRYEAEPPYEVLSTPDLPFSDLCFLKDVEEALEWYGNSGRYRRATALLTAGRSAFAAYAHLARGLRRSGLLDAERGERARAGALIGLGGELADRAALAELVRHDLLAAGRGRDLPDAAAFSQSPELREAVRARYHPVRGQLGCDYRYDVIEFEKTGRLTERPTRVLYDPAAREYQGI
ncbi:MAG: DUF4080 domain-containing protein, partial [Clostridiales bacterium]|nr:DUF4080 domain-containing protein [Clostridiales bacterium]